MTPARVAILRVPSSGRVATSGRPNLGGAVLDRILEVPAKLAG